MKRAKIYVVEAKVRFTKEKGNYRSSWIELEKKLAKKVYDNFKDLGKINFMKDEEKPEVLTFWANVWDKDIDIEYGKYILKMQVAEGNEKYPDPSISILEATLIGKDMAEVEVLEETNFSDTSEDELPKIEKPIAAPEVEEIPEAEEDNNFPY